MRTSENTLNLNAGKVNNRGIELKAGFNQNIGPVKWETTLTYTRNRNEIKELLDEYSQRKSWKGDGHYHGSVTVRGSPGPIGLRIYLPDLPGKDLPSCPFHLHCHGGDFPGRQEVMVRNRRILI